MDEKLDDVDGASHMPTTEVSKAIRPIAKDTVHKICSGQVVLSLAVAVKELVENSIDAGATLIEVKLKEQGLESLEVSDNGSGVEEHNLEGMTAKYHTSKIREFVDLQGVETFGFRGEALSSLCALSDMTIVTRHSSTKVATRLELDHEGKIKRRSPCAGTVGTTVTLCNLFATLPVRKREFKRNIKKEFTKMCQILQAYGLVSRGTRIICTNQNAKSGRSVFMKTHGTQDVLENIAAVFGSRQTADIIKIKPPALGYGNNAWMDKSAEKTLSETISEDDALNPEDLEIAAQFKLIGFVSSCTHGAGRSSKDRQYFYINSRPCDPKNVAKMVNEVYHRYNMQQYPFIYLNIILKRSDVDVNLTPDKRQLLINNEKILLLVIQKALINTFGSIPAIYKVQNSKISSMLSAETQQNVDRKKNSPKQVLQHCEENEVPKTTTKRFLDVLSQWKHTGDTEGVATPVATTKRKCSDEIEVRTLKLQKIHEYLTREGVTPSEVAGCSYASDNESDNYKKLSEELDQSTLDVKLLKRESNEFDKLTHLNETTLVERIDCKVLTPAKPTIRQLKFMPASETLLLTPTSQPSQSALSEIEDDDEDATAFATSQSDIGKTILLDDSASDEETSVQSIHPCFEICSSIAEIELSLQAENNIKIQCAQTKLERLRFKSEISPSQNTSAEQELQKEISKDMFAKMDIIGQFNLGFIIVKLDTDLFIVDQHATDEKYNFEMLQRTIVLHHQPLAVPQVLDMTAINEMILLDHLDVFEKNGFKFEINENAPLTKKIRLLGKPFSKNWQFGKDDIDELIFMLQDAPEGSICRPSRIRAMFASRACRKSVMIGRALNRATLKLLIQHMGEIEQPWNCPHGRPTMRHLINIAMLQDIDEKADK